MKKIVFILLFASLFLSLNAQKWVDIMHDSSANFYDIKKEFNEYWKNRPYERGKGYKQFMRWANFVEPRVYPTGNMANASRSKAYEEFQSYLQSNPFAKQIITATPSSITANWTPLGPYGSPTNGDAGRLQCIRFHPAGTNTIYVGTAAGGLWVSSNGGVSWTTNTDQLASLGINDIAIDPINPLNMYIATGDNDAGDTHSTGVLKSIDGGLTWNPTGLVWATSLQRRIGRLLINPLNPNKIIAATSAGMYRTFNGGATWSLTLAGGFKDAEYKPGDTTTVYCGGGSNFYRSTNGGTSYTGVSFSTLPSIDRSAIAVTPANPNCVYVLASNGTDESFGGLYRSTNSATSFSAMSSSPNVFGWNTTGTDAGGQGWYDLAIGASPTNSNEITVGGVNSWRSTNGGVTWALNTHWYGGGGVPYVHADLHDVQYTNGTTCYLGTDGGIAVTTNSGATFAVINGAMNISQQYRIGNSASSPTILIAGHQDNGTNLLMGTNWTEVNGGDGMDCFVDWSSNSTLVSSIYYGDFYLSTNSGTSWSNIVTGLTGTGAWVAPITQNPSPGDPNIFYCGMQDVFKSTNKGASWTMLAPLGSAGDVLHIEVAISNTNIIYASRAASIYQTTNGGTSWNSITGTLPVGTSQITDITIDNLNANNVYVTLSGYSAGNKVFYSTNGGVTWTNYSAGLPNIPANCIVYKNNSSGAVYVGTDVGVYYRELSMGSWIPYMSGLPNVVVNDLKIYYPAGKLRAGTYGRGTWETDLYTNPSSPPFAFYTNAYSSACLNLPFVFSDASSNNPTSWLWNFPGGAPPTSTVQNPSVTYTAAGIYTLTLVATNSVGTSSPFTSTVSVVNSPTATSTGTTICVGQTGFVSVSTNAASVVWTGNQTGTSAGYSPSTTSVYSYTASTGACQVIGTATITVGAAPVTPTVTQ
ncbi:MAG TPA: PKD domain-containing protein, partial [Bacteroidia bacterium]|nr:PKD domain-containing protein [Bacteroidia bacterium]